jgi:general secretion pathway protein L
MANTVFIRFHKDNSVDLYLPEDEAIVLSSMASGMQQIAESCRGKKLVVFIATSEVHLSTHIIPARNRQKILQAIPYTMEDDLIGDIQNFHFAIPTRLPTNAVPACAISRERLDQILDQLDEHRLHPQVIIPETLMLPCAAGEWNIIIEEHESAIQTAPYTGLSIDTDNLEAYLDMAIQEAGEQAPTQINVIDLRLSEHGTLLEQPENDAITISRTPAEAGLLPLLATHYHSDVGINLLQGEYAPRKIASQSYKKWYPALTLLGIILFIQAVSAIIHYVDISSESDMLEKQIKQVFQQSLPDVKRMVDPKSQMQQKLSALKSSKQGAGAGFLPILTKFSRAMQANNSIILKGLNFRNGRLDLELTINDLQALEKLKETMAQAGMQVDIRSATVQGKAVFARLRIQEAG